MRAWKWFAVILHLVIFGWLALFDNSAIAQCSPIFTNPTSGEIGHHWNGMTWWLGLREAGPSKLWDLRDQQPYCGIHVYSSTLPVEDGHVFQYQFDHREGLAWRTSASLINYVIRMNSEGQGFIGTRRPQIGQRIGIDFERLNGEFNADWLGTGSINDFQIVCGALARVPHLDDDFGQGVSIVFEPGFGNGYIGAGLSFADLSGGRDGVFRRFGASFSLLGACLCMYRGGSGVESGETRSQQSEKADEDTHTSPYRGLLSSIRSLPLGAQIRFAIIMSGLAWICVTWGIICLCDWRRSWQDRICYSFLSLFGFCGFGAVALIWG